MDERIDNILYQYARDDAGMFGGDADLTAVDISSSYDAFEDATLARLQAAYPGVRVSVQSGPYRIEVNGARDHDEIQWIGELVHWLWEAFDWVVQE